MKFYVALVTTLLLSYTSLPAQFHDNNVITGYDLFDDPSNGFGNSIFNFNDNKIKIEFIDSLQYSFYVSSIAFSDSVGNLLLSSNGLELRDQYYNVLLGSDSFNAYHHHDRWYRLGIPAMQAIIALPVGNNQISILAAKADHGLVKGVSTGFSTGIASSLIDMKLNAGLGEMIEKDIMIFQDTLAQAGILTSVKHANGRDWWTIVPRLQSNEYFTILTSPTGHIQYNLQSVGDTIGNGLISSTFSPDGKWYARNSVTDFEDDRLDLYKFDRATGELSDHVKEYFGGNRHWGGGVAFSPNSRFLYAIGLEVIYQYDLYEEDWQSTKTIVAVDDGFTEFIPNAHVILKFFTAWTGLDGKIYICSSTNTSYYHVIHYPNEKGENCQVEQHAIKLEAYHNRTVPNFPNYRLGPLDGSAADTLGFNNVPLARFRYEILEDREVRFTDGSWYEPETWLWSFDDGEVSADTSPYHTFSDTGIYHVCMTIVNVNGADTFCRDVVIRDSFSSSTDIHLQNQDILIYPNPASDYITIQSSEPIKGDFKLFALDGTLAKSQEIVLHADEAFEISVVDFPSGVYILEISEDNNLSRSEKIVITR